MQSNPLRLIPKPNYIRQRINLVEDELKKLQWLLTVSESLHNTDKVPDVIATCAPQHRHIVDQLKAAFDAGDFDAVSNTIQNAKAAGVRIKLNIAPGVVWDSETCELPTQADFEAVGRDLAIKASALEEAAAND